MTKSAETLSEEAAEVLIEALAAFNACAELEDERTGALYAYNDWPKICAASDSIREILTKNGYVI